ncbi:MAG: efflux RND transporter permease subunit, partial [Candidatus Eisenbacteria bacterium]|nr:efflux RND transporter permease subunit [Candidatus Eisenbacteria bacterium]
MSFSTARFSVHQPVLVNLLMIGIIVGGLFALFSMPQELNPNISFNWVFVTIPYPGASPQESEDLVAIPVEKELDKIDKVSEISTTAGESFAFFLVKFEEMSSSDFTAKMQEVRLAIDKAIIPDETEDPIVEDFGSDDFVPVFSAAITYADNREVAAAVADDIVDQIERIPDVAKIQVSGLEDREIWVEVDPLKLNAHHLTLGSVVRALATRNVNLPGGTIEVGRSEFQVRALGRFTSPDEISRLVLRSEPDGRMVRLEDVAGVRMTRAENSVLSRIDGQPSMTISVSKKAGGSTFAIVGQIKQTLAQYRERMPQGIDFITTIDTTRHIRDILGVLRNNAIFGLIIIFGLLWAFLGKSNALLASLGIPISFLVAFILMWLTGQTINGSSVFGMIIVLGILVDDAIVVLENIHRFRQQGVPLRDAVIRGTEEVLPPVTSGILTTVAAFVPLMLIPGIMGKFMRVIPIVVSLSLIASLFEASIMLPSHVHDWTRKSTRHQRPEFRFYVWLKARYERLLTRLLCRRYLVVGAVVLLLLVSIGLIPLVGVQMFGSEDLDFFRVLVKLPEGTSLEETDRVISKIESEALSLPEAELAYVEANSGLYQGNSEWTIRKNVGQVIVNLVDRHDRDRTIDEVIADLRERITGVAGISSLEFELPTSGPPTSKPVSVRVTGKYFEELRGAADELEAVLAGTDGVFDIADDFPAGKQEVRIAINEEQAALRGLTVQEIAMEVRTALSGLTATTYRDGDEDVDVVVKLPDSARNTLEEILALRMSTYTGSTIPLADVAEFSVHATVTEIHRRDLARTLIVGADIDKSKTTVDKVMRQLTPHFTRIANRYEEVQFEIGGEFEEFTEAFQDMVKLFAIGVILIYLILGT